MEVHLRSETLDDGERIIIASIRRNIPSGAIRQWRPLAEGWEMHPWVWQVGALKRLVEQYHCMDGRQSGFSLLCSKNLDGRASFQVSGFYTLVFGVAERIGTTPTITDGQITLRIGTGAVVYVRPETMITFVGAGVFLCISWATLDDVESQIV